MTWTIRFSQFVKAKDSFPSNFTWQDSNNDYFTFIWLWFHFATKHFSLHTKINVYLQTTKRTRDLTQIFFFTKYTQHALERINDKDQQFNRTWLSLLIDSDFVATYVCSFSSWIRKKIKEAPKHNWPIFYYVCVPKFRWITVQFQF